MPFKLVFVIMLFLLTPVYAQTETMAERLAGRVLLQVEQHGEAWYVNPGDHKKYYMGRPADAFALMRNQGIGISNADLQKIPAGIIDIKPGQYQDTDNDGLADSLESALGTDPRLDDSDGDGYGDLVEIKNGYDPLTPDKSVFDPVFTDKNAGKIFLQVENQGEAWYLDPVSKKRYFLARPDDAFGIMRLLGLGISNADLAKIDTFMPPLPVPEDQSDNTADRTSADLAMSGAADAIRKNDKEALKGFFKPEMGMALENTLDILGDEGRLTLGNILSGSNSSGSCTDTCTYTNKAYFSLGGYEVPLQFIVEKQNDGTWLITNL